MADHEEIEALLARVEAATGPDRNIDYRLFIAFAPKEVFSPWYPTEGHFYTSSLDAVVGLIERELPGYRWGLHRPQELFRGYVSKRSAFRPMPIIADAATPALALTAAFLRASTEKTSD